MAAPCWRGGHPGHPRLDGAEGGQDPRLDGAEGGQDPRPDGAEGGQDAKAAATTLGQRLTNGLWGPL